MEELCFTLTDLADQPLLGAWHLSTELGRSDHRRGDSLADRAQQAYANEVLRSFGAPPIPIDDGLEPGLIALHLAAAYHRIAVVLDVFNFYARNSASKGELRPFELVAASLGGRDARQIAADYYGEAIAIAPLLAEAYYGSARLHQAGGRSQEALDSFRRVVRLRPHPAAPAEAHLHANALWEQAQIFESLGDTAAALETYQGALARLDNFGVHHIRVANFLRRQELLAEATEHYRRCMRYSHRYFPEFLPPPLRPKRAEAAEDSATQVIHTLSSGEHVVFWEGAYFAVPGEYWPTSAQKLARLTKREVEPPLRRASSIAALERPTG